MIRRPEQFGKFSIANDGFGTLCGRQFGHAGLARNLGFEVTHDAFGLAFVSVQRKPARAFRKTQSKPPRGNGAYRGDRRDPTPSVDTEWTDRHQQPAEQRHHRHDQEFDELVERERFAAPLWRHEFGEECVDGHLFQPDADRRDKAADIDARGVRLARHDGSRERVPDQRKGEHGTASKPVGDRAEDHASEPHPREGAEDEETNAVDAKKAD